jgi:undecaprenyl pyrophosphate synthase
MQQTMNYQTSIADVEQEIVMQRHDLEEAQAKGLQLKVAAEENLQRSHALVDEAKQSVRSKTVEIKRKMTEASNLRSRLSGHQSTLTQKQRRLATARREAEKKKDKALFGAVSSRSSTYCLRNSL